VTPFALTSPSQFRPDHGPSVTVLKGKPSDAFRKEVDQQLRYSAGLTDTQKVIAQYWEDPPRVRNPSGPLEPDRPVGLAPRPPQPG
jgi:hypothetical protein